MPKLLVTVGTAPSGPLLITGRMTVHMEAQGMESTKGFFAPLFDFSFTTLITSKVIKFLYGISVIGAGLGALGFIIASFSNSVALGLVMLVIGAPLYFLLVVVYARVLLEIIMVIFQMAEHIAEIAAQGRRSPP
jgi:hypothetical protein